MNINKVNWSELFIATMFGGFVLLMLWGLPFIARIISK